MSTKPASKPVADAPSESDKAPKTPDTTPDAPTKTAEKPVKIKFERSHPAYGHFAGDETELPAAVAAELLEAGFVSKL